MLSVAPIKFPSRLPPRHALPGRILPRAPAAQTNIVIVVGLDLPAMAELCGSLAADFAEAFHMARRLFRLAFLVLRFGRQLG